MGKKNFEIRALTRADLPALKAFSDEVIGSGYYSLLELEEILEKSQRPTQRPTQDPSQETGDKDPAELPKMCSFLLVDPDKNEILGLRLTYPHGQWAKGKGEHLSPHLWKTPIESTAYFQSLFLHPKVRGEGWGEKLAHASLEVLRSLGAKAVVCHSWVESPGNSSAKYLNRIGFEPLTRYPHYWKGVNYECTRCGRPCLCTAEEMILYLT